MSNTYKSVNIPKEFEIIGGGGGEGGTSTPPYTLNFNSTDSWTLDNDMYFISVPAAIHNKGANVLVQVYESAVGGFEQVDIYILKTTGGSVSIRVPINNRFSGKLIIAGE